MRARLWSLATASIFALSTAAGAHAQEAKAAAETTLKEVVVTNTIPLTEEGKREPKIKVLSIAGLIARAIQSIHEETSVSRLFA